MLASGNVWRSPAYMRILCWSFWRIPHGRQRLPGPGPRAWSEAGHAGLFDVVHDNAESAMSIKGMTTVVLCGASQSVAELVLRTAIHRGRSSPSKVEQTEPDMFVSTFCAQPSPGVGAAPSCLS